ncbi:MAG: hypothetical protein HYW49_08780, partial [Deltaproteobacteria bacterium]|nr:hypothetical protein [Deltaproteobacteria bacterium]
AGFGATAAVASAAVLCLTRDYVLSSVRGYIEPILTFFVYAALWFVARHRRGGGILPAAAAGLSVWLAFFSKGPPAAWPFLFFGALFAFGSPRAEKKPEGLKGLGGYFVGFLVPTIAFVAWNASGDYWGYWKAYLEGQVLASAVEGRAGAQHLEPLYFAGILVKYYWPWLPFFLWALTKAFFGVRAPRGAMDREPVFWKRVFAITGLGFVAGFSLVKWKFWYYIAPAFPAFSLLIGATFARFLAAAEDKLTSFCAGAACAWVLAVAVFPIPLHWERAPEVMAFKETISGSPVAGPVWFIHSLRDHNIIGSSGQWYFGREVRKVSDAGERRWVESELRAPAWILTDKAHWNYCNSESPELRSRPWMKSWCARSKLVQSEKGMALVIYL